MPRPDEQPVIVWLRCDLRLDDNPALAHAVETGRPVVPLYVLEDAAEGPRALGGAHRWWLHHSLDRLGRSLAAKGSGVVLRRGRAADVVPALAAEVGAGAVFVNRRYAPAERVVDDGVEAALGERIPMQRFQANILHDPEAVRTKTGNIYKVYAPFRRNIEARGEPRRPLDAPDRAPMPPAGLPRSEALADWRILPTKPNWSAGLAATFQPGEAEAHRRFAQFRQDFLRDYEAGRQRPAADETSRMSPHLRWGEISPFRLWHDAMAHAARHPEIAETEIARFRSELLWRDFNYHLLSNIDDMAGTNIDRRFDRLEWQRDAGGLRAWQRGLTGYPIVDAGMRQLWRTGWMHNRVRMIVGSFLTRDLLIDWREGERWFWDTLVDGDVASNPSQWQWIAGTGADPQPFFRIFNPVTQSRTFDAGGDYIRAHVPELSKLPPATIHAPWEAEASTLAKAGVTLGDTYPRPIVDHGAARDRALAAYKTMRN